MLSSCFPSGLGEAVGVDSTNALFSVGDGFTPPETDVPALSWTTCAVDAWSVVDDCVDGIGGASGHPHLGHFRALSEIMCPHSEHFISAIFFGLVIFL